MIRFIYQCVDYDGTVLDIPMTITQDGVLSWEGYDPEPARVWKALSGRGIDLSWPSCLGALEIWEASPVNFLFKYGPATLKTSLRVGTDFAWHAWDHSATPMPDGIAGLLAYLSRLTALKKGAEPWIRKKLGEVEKHTYHEIQEHGETGDSASMWAIAATITVAKAWMRAIDGTVQAFPYLVGTATNAQQAAKGDRQYSPEYMREHRYSPEELEEQAWQLRHFVRVLESVQKGKPWPTV